MLENQHGISAQERATLEKGWAFDAQMGFDRSGSHPELVRIALVLVRPSIDPHEHPGGIKVSDGERVWYFAPPTQPCIDHGCRLYLWDDTPFGDFWVQHGRDGEAARRFPRRFLLESSFPLSAERPDVFEWIIECHKYEGKGGRT